MVSPPSRPGFGLLRCPHCRLELARGPATLACPNRHSFDIARQGYVNLLSQARRPTSAGGDTPDQLTHRAAFLAAGHFDLVASRIVDRLASSATPAASVIDAGCGTGYHLARMAALAPAPIIGLGLDIGREAVRRAGRAWPGLAFAVTDLWSEWPIKDAAADLVLSVFAPRNFAESARVLRPNGWLALVYPGPAHLAELDRGFGLIRRHAGKDQRYREAAEQAIGPCSIERLTHRPLLDGTAVRDAVLMGPNARHLTKAMLDDSAGPRRVTIDLTLLLARKL